MPLTSSDTSAVGRPARSWIDSTPRVTLLYLLVTGVMTWPLVTGVTRDIPADLGDSLLNCWILGWGADHLLRALHGDLGALAGFFDANIFHPEPLALAYSEHLVAQSVQIAPVYALTGNVILCYNLLFLSTFVLSALGMYLLVRQLTGRADAALIAGLIYAFVPYRVAQFPHLQVLSSQWMPFVLYGLRRYFDTGRARALGGASLALLAQNLSCSYFLVYFAPFVAAYVAFEMVTRGRLRDWRSWLAIGVAGIAVGAATWPFLDPYLQLRRLGFQPRSVDELQLFSANVYSYLTSHPAVRLLGGWPAAFPKPEGELFPGFVTLVLAAVALVQATVGAWRASGSGLPSPAGRGDALRGARVLALVVAAGYLAAAVAILLGGGFVAELGHSRVRMTNFNRSLTIAALAIAVVVALSHRARTLLVMQARSPFWFATAAALAAFWLSLGPEVRSLWHRLEDGPYLLLYRYVPGVDGLRVPARFGMIVFLFLAVVAGAGASWLAMRGRGGRVVLAAFAAVFLVETTAAPIHRNGTTGAFDLAPLPDRVYTGPDVPEVYRFLRTEPDSTVVLEFPFGEPPYEMRYVYYSTAHWRRLVNGFSGGFPASYIKRVNVLREPLSEPRESWEAVWRSGATHVIVHESLFLDSDGARVSTWLERNGTDRLYLMPPRSLIADLPEAR
jgi:hypothetical protein